MGWMSWEYLGCERDCQAFPDRCVSASFYKGIADELASGGWLEAGYTTVRGVAAEPGPNILALPVTDTV